MVRKAEQHGENADSLGACLLGICNFGRPRRLSVRVGLSVGDALLVGDALSVGTGFLCANFGNSLIGIASAGGVAGSVTGRRLLKRWKLRKLRTFS